MKKFLIAVAAFALAYVPASLMARDQSTYANQDARVGIIVREWDYTDGATGSIDLGADLPEGALFLDGYVEVTQAIAPATATNALTVYSTGDILANGTTLNSAGLTRLTLVSDGTVTPTLTKQTDDAVTSIGVWAINVVTGLQTQTTSVTYIGPDSVTTSTIPNVVTGILFQTKGVLTNLYYSTIKAVTNTSATATWTAGAGFSMTSSVPLQLTLSGSTATQGAFMVYLPYLYTQDR